MYSLCIATFSVYASVETDRTRSPSVGYWGREANLGAGLGVRGDRFEWGWKAYH